MAQMKAPDGRVLDIVPAGVAALTALGWEELEKEKSGDGDASDPGGSGEETPQEGSGDAAETSEEPPADDSAEDAPDDAEEPAKPARRTRRKSADDSKE